ncbi:MAG: hypothetical protein AAFN79_17995 [Pseudomonadota bacterium]
MIYQRTANETALKALFGEGGADGIGAPEQASAPVLYLIHFSQGDVELMRASLGAAGRRFLPSDWYLAEVVGEDPDAVDAGSLGDMLRRKLAAFPEGAVVPVNGGDFFACARQGAFDATRGAKSFLVLGRRRAHEFAASRFIEIEGNLRRRLADLTREDFEWLFEASFTISQQRALAIAYIDVMFGPHVAVVFDVWRQDPDAFFSRYFSAVGLGALGEPARNREPSDRLQAERKIANWFAEKMTAQIASWNRDGWPVVAD